MSKRRGHKSQPVFLNVSANSSEPVIVPFNRAARRLFRRKHRQINLIKPVLFPLHLEADGSYTRTMPQGQVKLKGE